MTTVSREVGYATLRVQEPHPGVCWIALNRPERLNAIDRQLGEELYAVLDHALAAPGTRVVVVTGEGRSFCAGDDLGAVEEHLRGIYTHSPVIGTTPDPMYLRIIEMLVTSRVPVIMAVNGDAAGAGAELACAGDLRIASTRARLGSALLNVAQAGGLVMMSRLVGTAKATEIYLSGALLDAREAERLGIFTTVVEHEDLAGVTLAEARRLADAPTAAIGLFKELREQAIGQPVQHALRLQNAVHIRNNAEVVDAVEGATAFIEKRRPRFEGK
ncbi:enoyl-CoA hydratase/isomerase family protein [Pimelobacter simplex]|uniref:Enoyl-CoA hydratase n=1 Tax=Nocardioides simplex TaxID=2045 RepID=A0A7J5DY40_NOCSI|nr:enoyl-CoA hydratase-related protein [Pimelobacter simplex]KAB2810900.1 enoyl-CoA hydratase [Pimelobacter simplex]